VENKPEIRAQVHPIGAFDGCNDREDGTKMAVLTDARTAGFVGAEDGPAAGLHHSGGVVTALPRTPTCRRTVAPDEACQFFSTRHQLFPKTKAPGGVPRAFFVYAPLHTTNTKSETRNPKQIRNPKEKNSKPILDLVWDFELGISDLFRFS
jgi:hypothetical protein